MKIRRNRVLCAVLAVTMGILSPQLTLGDERVGDPQASAVHPPVVTDVALQDGGVLFGRVVGEQGVAKPGVEVAVLHGGREVATSRTDQTGQFKFAGLQAGVHQLATPYGGGQYRLWAPRTAPPVAQPGIVVVEDQVVRGQEDNSRCRKLRRAACIAGVGLGIAGAIVAIDHNPPGS